MRTTDYELSTAKAVASTLLYEARLSSNDKAMFDIVEAANSVEIYSKLLLNPEFLEQEFQRYKNLKVKPQSQLEGLLKSNK